MALHSAQLILASESWTSNKSDVDDDENQTEMINVQLINRYIKIKI